MLVGCTLVVGTNLKESDGTRLNGVIEFTPVLGAQSSTAYRSGTSNVVPSAYSSTVVYGQGDCVLFTDSNIYMAIANNTRADAGQSPGGNGWVLVQPGALNEGQTSTDPVYANVVNGAFAIVLPDVSMTIPAFISFNAVAYVYDPSLPTLNYSGIQPTGGVLNFDTFAPVFAAVPFQVVPGWNFRGSFSASTVYLYRDVFTANGASYFVNAPFLSGLAFSFSDPITVLAPAPGATLQGQISALSAGQYPVQVIGSAVAQGVPQNNAQTIMFLGTPVARDSVIESLPFNASSIGAAGVLDIVIAQRAADDVLLVTAIIHTQLRAVGLQTLTAGIDFPPTLVPAGSYVGLRSPDNGVIGFSGATGTWLYGQGAGVSAGGVLFYGTNTETTLNFSVTLQPTGSPSTVQRGVVSREGFAAIAADSYGQQVEVANYETVKHGGVLATLGYYCAIAGTSFHYFRKPSLTTPGAWDLATPVFSDIAPVAGPRVITMDPTNPVRVERGWRRYVYYKYGAIAIRAYPDLRTTGPVHYFVQTNGIGSVPATATPSAPQFGIINMNFEVYADPEPTAVPRGLAPLYDVDFSQGLPPDWNGGWTVSGAGAIPPATGSAQTLSQAAFFGLEGRRLRVLFEILQAGEIVTIGYGGGINDTPTNLVINAATGTIACASSTSSTSTVAALGFAMSPGNVYVAELFLDSQRVQSASIADPVTGILARITNAGSSIDWGVQNVNPFVTCSTGHMRLRRATMLADAPAADVLILGDSNTFGQGVTPALRWPGLLQAALPGARVLVSGVQGALSAAGASMAFALIQALRPRTVIWALGTNDANFPLSPGDLQRNASYCGFEAQRFGAKFVVCAIPPQGGVSSSGQDAFNAALQAVPHDAYVRFDLALTTGNDGHTQNASDFQGDALHFTAAGHQACFNRFAVDAPDVLTLCDPSAATVQVTQVITNPTTTVPSSLQIMDAATGLPVTIQIVNGVLQYTSS